MQQISFTSNLIAIIALLSFGTSSAILADGSLLNADGSLLNADGSLLDANGSTSNQITGDYIAGEEANKRGDRQTAFQEFYAAAKKGDGRAYGKLGSMYLYGLGTKKDYHQAYIWFHMAHLNGERTGERFRDTASSVMTREEYLKAVEAAENQRIEQKLGKAPPQQMPPGASPQMRREAN